MFSSLFFVPWIRIPNGAQRERGYGSALYLQYTNTKHFLEEDQTTRHHFNKTQKSGTASCC